METLVCRDAFVAIASIQWAQMVHFYRHLTNHPPNPHISHSYAEFSIGGLRIGLFHPKASHQPEFSYPKGAGISLCLEVKDLEQSRIVLDHIYATLPFASEPSSMSFPIDSSPMERSEPVSPQRPYGPIAIASHGRECYAYDPDGNRLILHESIVQTAAQATIQA